MSKNLDVHYQSPARLFRKGKPYRGVVGNGRLGSCSWQVSLGMHNFRAYTEREDSFRKSPAQCKWSKIKPLCVSTAEQSVRVRKLKPLASLRIKCKPSEAIRQFRFPKKSASISLQSDYIRLKEDAFSPSFLSNPPASSRLSDKRVSHIVACIKSRIKISYEFTQRKNYGRELSFLYLKFHGDTKKLVKWLTLWRDTCATFSQRNFITTSVNTKTGLVVPGSQAVNRPQKVDRVLKRTCPECLFTPPLQYRSLNGIRMPVEFNWETNHPKFLCDLSAKNNAKIIPGFAQSVALEKERQSRK